MDGVDGSCVELQQIGMRFELDAFGIYGLGTRSYTLVSVAETRGRVGGCEDRVSYR